MEVACTITSAINEIIDGSSIVFYGVKFSKILKENLWLMYGSKSSSLTYT
jgi:hypothetical protein